MPTKRHTLPYNFNKKQTSELEHFPYLADDFSRNKLEAMLVLP
jgi:hypothetical protein